MREPWLLTHFFVGLRKQLPSCNCAFHTEGSSAFEWTVFLLFWCLQSCKMKALQTAGEDNFPDFQFVSSCDIQSKDTLAALNCMGLMTHHKHHFEDMLDRASDTFFNHASFPDSRWCFSKTWDNLTETRKIPVLCTVITVLHFPAIAPSSMVNSRGAFFAIFSQYCNIPLQVPYAIYNPTTLCYWGMCCAIYCTWVTLSDHVPVPGVPEKGRYALCADKAHETISWDERRDIALGLAYKTRSRLCRGPGTGRTHHLSNHGSISGFMVHWLLVVTAHAVLQLHLNLCLFMVCSVLWLFPRGRCVRCHYQCPVPTEVDLDISGMPCVGSSSRGKMLGRKDPSSQPQFFSSSILSPLYCYGFQILYTWYIYCT